MNGLDLKIDGEALNKYLAEKVLESALGDSVRKAVDEALADSWNRKSMIDGAVKLFVQQQVTSLLHDEFAEVVRERIRELLSDDVLDRGVAEVVSKVWAS